MNGMTNAQQSHTHENRKSTERLQHVPSLDVAFALGKHLVPVFDLQGAALTAQEHLTDEFISAHPVVVHDGYEETCLSDLVTADQEWKGFFEGWIQAFFFDHGLSFLHSFALEHEPDLDVRI